MAQSEWNVNRNKFLWRFGFVVFLAALAKVAAFIKDLLLSLQFGAGPQADAYFVANTIPGFMFGGVFATIGMVFLPAFKRAQAEGEIVAATTYRTAAVGYSILGLVLGGLTFGGSRLIVSLLAPDLPEATHDLAVVMTKILSFSFVFSGWVGLQSAVLQAHKKLIWPQVVQTLSHVFVVGGLLLAVMTGGSITLLTYAAVVGWIVVALLISRRSSPLWPVADGRWFDWKSAASMAALSFPVFLSLSLDQVGILIGTYLSSSFPEGAISHLNYAQRLMILQSSVFALIVAYVLFPYLTESVIADRTDAIQRSLGLAIISVLLFSAPLLVLSLCMGDALTAFIFERGAFGPEDAIAAGKVLACFAPVIILAGVREVLNRLFLAWQKTSLLLLFGALAMLVNVIASVYFSGQIGLQGIALGTTCGSLIYVGAQISIILTRGERIFHPDLPAWLVVIAFASVVSALTGLWIDGMVDIANYRLRFIVSAGSVLLTFCAAVMLSILLFARLREIYTHGVKLEA